MNEKEEQLINDINKLIEEQSIIGATWGNSWRLYEKLAMLEILKGIDYLINNIKKEQTKQMHNLLKVGDTVKVRSDLKDGQKYGDERYYDVPMAQLKGTIQTISYIVKKDIPEYDFANMSFHWTLEMFEWIAPRKLTVDMVKQDKIGIWIDDGNDYDLFAKWLDGHGFKWRSGKKYTEYRPYGGDNIVMYISEGLFDTHIMRERNYVVIKFNPSMLEIENKEEIKMDNKNYWPEIAKMLGVEIGEEFVIESYFSRYCINEDGLQSTNKSVDLKKVLIVLLSGECAIKKLPWKPKQDDVYFYWNPEGSLCRTNYRITSTHDNYCVAHNNCFRTKETANKPENRLAAIKGLGLSKWIEK